MEKLYDGGQKELNCYMGNNGNNGDISLYLIEREDEREKLSHCV